MQQRVSKPKRTIMAKVIVQLLLSHLWRQITNFPGYSALVLVTFVFGAGLNSSMYSIVNGVLYKPLPYSGSTPLVRIMGIGQQATKVENIKFQDIREWQEQSHAFDQISFYGSLPKLMERGRDYSEAQQVTVVYGSEELFLTLGVKARLGRTILPADRGENLNIVVLSSAVWRVLYGSNPKVIGQLAHLDGVPYTIIGVMPPEFQFPDNLESMLVWVPFVEGVSLGGAKESKSFLVVGRLKSGRSISTAQEELSEIQSAIASDGNGSEIIPDHVLLTPYRDSVAGGWREGLWALQAAMLFFWLLANCNLAGISLLRALKRRKEIAIRIALGANRWDLARELFLENFGLCLLGLIAAYVLVNVSMTIFLSFLAAHLPLGLNNRPDIFVFVFLFVLSTLCALVISIVPALAAPFSSFQRVLQENSPSGGSMHSNTMGQVTIIVEFALSLTLIVGAGLMFRTIYNLKDAPIGFRTSDVLISSFKVPAFRHEKLYPELFGPLLQRVKGLPGVREAALSTVLPIGHTSELMISFNIPEYSEKNANALARAATPGLEKVLGIRVLRGRFISDQDIENTQLVAVINSAFARMYFPGKDVIGRRLKFNGNEAAVIVGVIDDIRQEKLSEPSAPELYFSLMQMVPGKPFYDLTASLFMQLAVFTQGAPDTFIPAVRRAMLTSDSSLAIGESMTMDAAVAKSIGNQLLGAKILGFFAFAGLIMAIIGLYSTVAFHMKKQRRDIAIRMALGANARHIVVWIFTRVGAVIVIGNIIGILMSIALSRGIAAFLYQVNPVDPIVLAIATFVMVTVGGLSAYIPVRMAIRRAPLQELK